MAIERGGVQLDPQPVRCARRVWRVLRARFSSSGRVSLSFISASNSAGADALPRLPPAAAGSKPRLRRKSSRRSGVSSSLRLRQGRFFVSSRIPDKYNPHARTRGTNRPPRRFQCRPRSQGHTRCSRRPSWSRQEPHWWRAQLQGVHTRCHRPCVCRGAPLVADGGVRTVHQRAGARAWGSPSNWPVPRLGSFSRARAIGQWNAQYVT